MTLLRSSPTVGTKRTRLDSQRLHSSIQPAARNAEQFGRHGSAPLSSYECVQNLAFLDRRQDRVETARPRLAKRQAPPIE